MIKQSHYKMFFLTLVLVASIAWFMAISDAASDKSKTMKTNYVCKDSDSSKEPFEYGKVRQWIKKPYQKQELDKTQKDSCKNMNILIEYYCADINTNKAKGNIIKSKNINCNSVCPIGRTCYCHGGECKINFTLDSTPPELTVNVYDSPYIHFGNTSSNRSYLNVTAWDNDSFVSDIGVWYRLSNISSWIGWDKIFLYCHNQTVCQKQVFIYPISGSGIYEFKVEAFNRDMAYRKNYLFVNFA